MKFTIDPAIFGVISYGVLVLGFPVMELCLKRAKATVHGDDANA